jgi:hypothetical protein
MKQGPTEIIECPHCQSLNLRKIYLSWNNIGIEIWSDFRYFGKGVPEIHALVKCHNCQQFFWMNELEEIADYDKNDPAHISAAYPLIPEMQDYMDALQISLDDTKDKERYVRKWIWWTYNDGFRNGPLYKHKISNEIRENLAQYTRLLDTNDQDDKLILAEAYRELESFAESLEVLNGITQEEGFGIKILERTRMEDPRLFRLQ